MEIQQNTPQVSADVEKQQSWDKFQSQYGAKIKPQRQVKKTLDKDDFLKIMITQMKHQDPTEPFAADKLAQEIAQITSVEQLGNVNKAIESLVKKNDPIERLTMTHLIGKTVTVDPNRFSHESGYQSNLPFNLNKDAESVNIKVLSSKGEVVFNKDIGPQKAGQNSYLWNGIKENTLPAESDVYMINVEAVTKEGSPISLSPSQKTKIIGVSFTGTEPSFIVGDSKNYTRVPMKNIIQIEDSGAQSSVQEPLPVMLNNGDNSKPQNPFQMAAQNFKPQEEQSQNMPTNKNVQLNKVSPVIENEEKGFPNGLGHAIESRGNL